MSLDPDSSFPPARILIVDDERQNRQLLEVMLTPEGFHLLAVANGEEALTIVAEQAPDLILLDVMMPGVSGFKICQRLKSEETTALIPMPGSFKRRTAICTARAMRRWNANGPRETT